MELSNVICRCQPDSSDAQIEHLFKIKKPEIKATIKQIITEHRLGSGHVHDNVLMGYFLSNVTVAVGKKLIAKLMAHYLKDLVSGVVKAISNFDRNPNRGLSCDAVNASKAKKDKKVKAAINKFQEGFYKKNLQLFLDYVIKHKSVPNDAQVNRLTELGTGLITLYENSP